jgi:hypothetical protein
MHGNQIPVCLAILRNLDNSCGQTGARIALLEMVLPEVGTDIVRGQILGRDLGRHAQGSDSILPT